VSELTPMQLLVLEVLYMNGGAMSRDELRREVARISGLDPVAREQWNEYARAEVTRRKALKLARMD